MLKIRSVLIVLALFGLIFFCPAASAETAGPYLVAAITRNPAGQWELPLALLGYGEAVRISGQLEQRELHMPIPDGLHPIELRTLAFTSPDVESGYLEVLDGQRSLFSLALQPPQMSLTIPLGEAMVQGQRLSLTFLVRLRTVDDACVNSLTGAWLDLRSVALVLGGEARPPTTVGVFFPPILSGLRLFVPPSPTAAEAEAALRLAMAVTSRYAPQRPAITLEALAQDEALPLGAESMPFERAVVIRESSSTRIALEAGQAGWPLLLMSGPAPALSRASRLLVDDLAPAAAAPSLSSIEFDRPEQLQGERLALSSLGNTRLQVSGVGRMEIPFSFAQADLGGPIRTLALRLLGTYTPPAAGARAMLSVLFNATLLRTIPLEREGAFDLYLSMPQELLYRDNLLTVRFEYTPPEGRCRLGVDPFTAQVGPGSYVQVQRGQALPAGFGRFPQALSRGFEVAFEQFDQDSLSSALGMVVALQRLSKIPLHLTMVPWGSALLSKEPALLVAANPHSAAELKPPLIPEPLAVTDQGGGELLRLEADATFAALEAFESQGRDVLLLTRRGSQGPELQRRLISALEDGPQGWSALQGDVLLQTGPTEPQELHLRGGGLKAESLAPSRLSWWPSLRPVFYLLALGLLLFFLVWAYPRVVRRGPGQ